MIASLDSLGRARAVVNPTMLLFVGCADSFSEEHASQAIIDYGSARLHMTWMEASHNTYQPGHTDGPTIAYHLQNTTNHIELDLRDTMDFGSIPGDWIVAHGPDSSEVTTYCGLGNYTLTSCLTVLRDWHLANPGHPLVTVWIDKKEPWQSQWCFERSACRLDALLGFFFDGSLFRPGDMSSTSLRSVLASTDGWPEHDSLNDKFMFIITSDADSTGNGRLNTYVNWHLWNARAFVAPYANHSNWLGCSQVTGTPTGFNSTTTPWVAVYNFKWQSAIVGSECNNSTCYCIPTAHGSKFLSRVWDIDDPDEADAASARPDRGGTYGHANFIAVDAPGSEPPDTEKYSPNPDGTYSF